MEITNIHNSSAITAVYVGGEIALDPADEAWSHAPEIMVDLDRMINEAGIRMSSEPHENRRVKVKAVHNGTDIFFFYRWNESTASIAADDYDIFADAFAMEIPLLGQESILCMGALHKPVNIIYWRPDLPGPENLLAAGMGTPQISPDEASQNIRHYQQWTDGVWSVILTRHMAASSANQIAFVRGAEYSVAFANWKGGAYAERGGHKMISDWQVLYIQ